MDEEFEIEQLQSNFDFKGFLLKIVSFWPLFIISLLIAYGIAYSISIRKLPVYQMGNLISIKDDQNPFFTTNTSLTFNWGGTTDKVNTSIVMLKTRSHNEKVVEKLQYYISYLKKGEYQLINAYGQTPFTVQADTLKHQILNKLIKITAKDSLRYTLSVSFEEGNFPPRSTTQKTVLKWRCPPRILSGIIFLDKK
jgi:uncharacterized protein involved in exopolysaccharide biosynthesis